MPLSPVLLRKLAERAARFAALEAQIADPVVAGDGKRFPELLRERGRLEHSAELHARAEQLAATRAEAEALLADDDADADLRQLAEDELEACESEEETLEDDVKRELVRDEGLARRKVIVEVRAGTGGDEATLFAKDLFEIYARFAEARRWKRELLEVSPSEVGGFKDVTFALEGDDVWNLMRFESGGHRVQRVPATESQGRIHTSAATVAVLPEAEAVEIDVQDEDLRIDTMRAGGPGGQSVNTTASAVRITHLPTGTVVQCQDEKSQLKNKNKALRVLRARLLEAEEAKRHAERSAARKGMVGTGDRSQRVRTYNWPQNRVTDHRLDHNVSLEHVLAGRLGPLLEELAELDREARIAAL